MVKLLWLVILVTLTGCGRTLVFKDGQVADQHRYDADYNNCVRESKPLYPMVLVQQFQRQQVPVYGIKRHDNHDERVIVRYDTRLVPVTVDMNENDREAYVSRCVSAKGYTYRYLSKEELEAMGYE
jgi:hypothetical protein